MVKDEEGHEEKSVWLCASFCNSGWNNEVINVNFGFGMKKMMPDKLVLG